MEEKHTSNAAKAAGMISIMFLISRILGFVRESLAGSLFNRFQTDAFFAAFVIPDVMYYLLVGGALSAAFIPVFTEYLAKGEEEEGWKMASTFINLVVLFLVVITTLGVIFTRWMTPVIAPSFKGEKLQLLIGLTRIMFPGVCFTALAGLMGGVLNSYRRFLGPALGPNVYNIGIIIGAGWLGSTWGIQGMAYGVLVGAIGNFVTQLFFLKKCGGRFYRFGYIDFHNAGFWKMFLLWLPALIGLSADQANIWATTAMASGLPEGGITAIRFATRLVQLPIGIFAAGISMAFFPLLSSQVAENKMDHYKDTLSLALRSIFFILIPAGIGLMALGTPLVTLLFEHGKFTVHNTNTTTQALWFYSLAVFAHAAILIMPRAFYALKDTRTPVFVSFISVSASIFFNWFFLQYTHLGVKGFGISFTIMGLLNMVLLMVILRRKVGGIRGKGILMSFTKSAISSLIMGLLIWVSIKSTTPFISHFSKHMGAALQIVGGLTLGGAAYIAGAWLLKMDELKMAIDLVKRRLRKASNA